MHHRQPQGGHLDGAERTPPRTTTKAEAAVTAALHPARDQRLPLGKDQPQGVRRLLGGGRVAHAFFYPPKNDDIEKDAASLPPVIVISHGGPTSLASNTLKLAPQYWTSRGFGVLDVTYGGSSGFGRADRDALKGQWGIVDVADCIAGARHLVERGLADAERLAYQHHADDVIKPTGGV